MIKYFINCLFLKKFTVSLVLSIVITVLGGTLAVGFHIGLFNTPSLVIKEFYNVTYFERYGNYSTDDTVFWSLANGALPLGGTFGGLITGLVIEKFGRFSNLLLNHHAIF